MKIPYLILCTAAPALFTASCNPAASQPPAPTAVRVETKVAAAATPTSPATAPHQNLTEIIIDTQEISSSFPGKLKAGWTRVVLNNSAMEKHEFFILHLADGKSMQDAVRFLDTPEGPSPFTQVGSIDGLETAPSGSTEVELRPGRYVAVFKIPAIFAGVKPDFIQRIIKEFTVPFDEW